MTQNAPATTRGNLTPEQAQDQWKQMVADKARRAISSMLTGDRAKQAYGRILVAMSSAALTSPDIMRCSEASIVRAIAMSALTGIMPGGAMAKVYLIPKQIKRVWELQWWANHRALKGFANAAGWDVSCTPVHVEDEFSIENDVITHRPDPDRNCNQETLRGFVVRAWPFAHPESKSARFVNRETIEARRAKSDSKDSEWSPWNNWFLEMAEKTALKYAAARGLFPLDDAADYISDESPPPLALQAPAPAITHTPQPSAFAELAQAVGAHEIPLTEAEKAEAQAREKAEAEQ